MGQGYAAERTLSEGEKDRGDEKKGVTVLGDSVDEKV